MITYLPLNYDIPVLPEYSSKYIHVTYSGDSDDCSVLGVVFYPNVTTLRSGLCYRNSVCRLSETLVHPTQGIEAFGKISSPLCTLAIL